MGPDPTATLTGVSFVVIAFNEERHIQRTLESIVTQEALGAYEIIVVDDCSTDRTRALAGEFAREHPAVRVIGLPENRGRGFARAVGIDAATGSVLATVDADIVLPPDWYRRCCQELRGAAAVAGTAVPDGDVTYIYRAYGLEPKPVPASTAVTGNNAMYDRRIFETLRFDPALREGEDVALNEAMRALDLKVRTLDDLYVLHEEAKSFRRSVAWLFQSGVGASRQLRRYGRLRLPDLVFVGFLGAVGAATLGLVSRRGSLLSAGLPVAYVLATSGAHLQERFILPIREPRRVGGAIATDSVLLTAYFAGRVVGTITQRD